MSWIRESLSPNVRQKNTEEEIEAARRRAAEKGQLNIFESLPSVEDGKVVETSKGREVAEKVVPAWKQKTYTEVRRLALQALFPCSTRGTA